jgi:hypothetical protein
MKDARGRVGEADQPPRTDAFAGFAQRRDRNQRAGRGFAPRRARILITDRPSAQV